MGSSCAKAEAFQIVVKFSFFTFAAAADTTHDPCRSEAKRVHAVVHGVGAQIIQHHIRGRVVANEHHQANTVLQTQT